MKYISIFAVSVLMLLALTQVAAAFGPTTAFPNNNPEKPIHLGGENQEKNGGLSVGSFFGTLKAIFAGDVHIGDDTPPLFDQVTIICLPGHIGYPGCLFAEGKVQHNYDLILNSQGGFALPPIPQLLAAGSIFNASSDDPLTDPVVKYNSMLCVRHSDGQVIACPSVPGTCSEANDPGQFFDSPYDYVSNTPGGIQILCGSGRPFILSEDTTSGNHSDIVYSCLGKYGGLDQTNCVVKHIPHGSQTYYASTTIDLPFGVNSVTVEALGGGGGGGASGEYEFGGGGGGSGAYVKAVLSTHNGRLPGGTNRALNITVGGGGSGGGRPSTNSVGNDGGNGGNSGVSIGSYTLTAGGGAGGKGSYYSNNSWCHGYSGGPTHCGGLGGGGGSVSGADSSQGDVLGGSCTGDSTDQDASHLVTDGSRNKAGGGGAWGGQNCDTGSGGWAMYTPSGSGAKSSTAGSDGGGGGGGASTTCNKSSCHADSFPNGGNGGAGYVTITY